MREKLMQWLSDLNASAETPPQEADFGLDMAPPPEALARAGKPEAPPPPRPVMTEAVEDLRRRADRP